MTFLNTMTKLSLLAIMICSLFFTHNLMATQSLNSSQSFAANTAFTGANLINPNAELPITNATILVSNGNIVKIQSDNESIPDDYALVDIKGKWVIPGLIDGHIHLAQSGSAYTRPDTIDATQLTTYQLDQDWLNNNLDTLLARYPRLGITTVADMGGPTEYLQLYKKLSHSSVAPDIYAAGTLLAPMELPELNKTFTKVTSSNEARELVSQLNNSGNALVKIYWTLESGLTHQQLTDLYKLAILLAKEQGKVVAAHVSSLMDAKMAVRAGANILLHGVMTERVDDELIELMKQNRVTYMPTLTAESHYVELFRGKLEFTEHEQRNSDKFVLESFQTLIENKDKTGQMFQLISKFIAFVDASDENIAKLSTQEQNIVKQLQEAFPTENPLLQKSNLKRVYQAGVNVALGTDAGNPGTLHAASYYGEILAWQDAGVPNAAILMAATLNNAKALNIQDKVGALSIGKHADFVVLHADPRENMATLMHPLMTIKRGTQVKGE